jgi:aspartokinase
LNEQEGTVVKASKTMQEKRLAQMPQQTTQKANHDGMEDFVVTGVTVGQDQFFIQVHLNRTGVLSALWDKAKSLHLAVIAPVFFETEVRFFSEREGEKEWQRALDELQIQGFVKSFLLNSSVVPLSIIGDRFLQDSTALQEMIEILTQENIPIVFGTASAFAVTVGVSQHQIDSGVQALHRHFLEKEYT